MLPVCGHSLISLNVHSHSLKFYLISEMRQESAHVLTSNCGFPFSITNYRETFDFFIFKSPLISISRRYILAVNHSNCTASSLADNTAKLCCYSDAHFQMRRVKHVYFFVRLYQAIVVSFFCFYFGLTLTETIPCRSSSSSFNSRLNLFPPSNTMF